MVKAHTAYADNTVILYMTAVFFLFMKVLFDESFEETNNVGANSLVVSASKYCTHGDTS